MGLPVIKLGLVGAIAKTAMHVLNPLLRQTRFQLTEVFDPCLAAAKESAQLLDSTFSPSLDGLIRRSQGIIIGDVGWTGLVPLLRAAELQKPTLVLQSVIASFSPEQLQTAQNAANQYRSLLMPDLSYRWARSTLRLRELTATQAGAIEQMEITCQGDEREEIDLMVLDWCANVVQSECRSIHVDSQTGTTLLKFRRLSRQGEPVAVRIQRVSSAPTSAFAIQTANIACRHGQIQLIGEGTLKWEIDRRKASESLASDRSAAAVMFDLFGRRLVGGLVPIPEIPDLIKAHTIRRAGAISRIRNEEIPLFQN